MWRAAEKAPRGPTAPTEGDRRTGGGEGAAHTPVAWWCNGHRAALDPAIEGWKGGDVYSYPSDAIFRVHVSAYEGAPDALKPPNKRKAPIAGS